jgi:hypothetical protein
VRDGMQLHPHGLDRRRIGELTSNPDGGTAVRAEIH